MSMSSPSSILSPRTKVLTPRRSLLQSRHIQKTNAKLPPVIKTSLTVLENYGLPLPVLITETLTFADNNTDIFVRLSPGGWGWVVSGRRLLVWQYREIRQKNASGNSVSCYELTLPQTNLAHKADLVCVYTSEGAQIPSCISISPEGSVRYWSSIAHEGGYVEEVADLHGQECDMLIDVSPNGCILVTTTCTVVSIQPTTAAGRHAISIRTLRGSESWLGGIGRRVSSMFFSAMPSSQSVETKLVGVTTLGRGSVEEPQRMCVVAGSKMQLWELGVPEKIITEVDLLKNLREAYIRSHAFAPGDTGLMDIHIFDIQYWNDSLLLLTAASNSMRTPPIRYALAQICIEEELGPGQIINFITLHRYIFDGNLHHSGGEGGSHSLRMIATSNTVILYENSNIAVTSCTTSNDKVDVINFLTNADRILGGGLCFGVPLLFSKSHGVLSVSSVDNMLNENSLIDSPLASPRPSDIFDGQLSFYELDPKSVVDARDVSIRGSTVELVKAAFLHHIRREFQSSKALLNDIFPPNNDIVDVDTSLDRNVFTIVTDLVNDVPASDPRWSKAHNSNAGASLGSSGSLQILLQLQDKRRALSLLYEFLRTSGLWFRLGGATDPSTVLYGVGPVPTVLLLRGLAEKLTAAITLRTIQQQSQYQTIIDTAIQQVLSSSDDDEEERGMTSSILSPSDLFYKSVSRVERGLIAAMQWCNQQNESEGATTLLTQLISKVNHVVLAVLQEVVKHRQQQADFYSVASSVERLRLETTSWTSSPHSNGLQQALFRQHAISIQRARQATRELKSMLKAQAAEIASVLLEFAFERVEGFPIDSRRREVTMRDFTKIRSDLILPFVEDEEWDHAMALAEKFHDFETLIYVCEHSNNREKLYYYMEKFKNLGFQQCAFRWFMVRGRGGQASLLKSFPQYGEALAKWLSEQETESHTDDKNADKEYAKDDKGPLITIDGTELLWLHELNAEKWKDASQTLLQLAETEVDSINKMTTQASLSKLCALASEVNGPEDEELISKIIQRANDRLTLAEHHTLPHSLLTFHGMDPDNVRVMEPREIIDMYIVSTGKDITEYDYCRVLSLCDLAADSDDDMGKSEILELRRRLWCSIILTDLWSDYNKNSPLSTVQDKMFFKVIDTVHLLNLPLEDYLLPLDDILSSRELEELSKDECFLFIMKAGYEHVHQSYFMERMVVE